MKKSEITRQRILEAAVDIVASKGYSASSTKEIAKKAGVSEATIFKYYNSKDELLKNIVVKTLEQLYDYSVHKSLPEIFAHEKEATTEELLEELITERLEFFQDNFQAIQVIFQEMMINEPVRSIFKNMVWSKMDNVIENIINRGKERGQLKEIDNYFVKKVLFGIIFFTIGFEPILFEKESPYSSKEQAEMICNILFEGIKNTTPRPENSSEL